MNKSGTCTIMVNLSTDENHQNMGCKPVNNSKGSDKYYI